MSVASYICALAILIPEIHQPIPLYLNEEVLNPETASPLLFYSLFWGFHLFCDGKNELRAQLG